VKGGERRRLCERGWCVGRDSPNRFYCQDYEQRKCVWAGQVRCSRPTYVNASCSPHHHASLLSTIAIGPHLIILYGSLFVGQEQPALNIIMSNLYGRSKSTYAASKPSAAASPRATMKDNQRVLRHLHHTQRQSTRLTLRHAMGSLHPRQVLARISLGGWL
jgi:hypothetical protein